MIILLLSNVLDVITKNEKLLNISLRVKDLQMYTEIMYMKQKIKNIKKISRQEKTLVL